MKIIRDLWSSLVSCPTGSFFFINPSIVVNPTIKLWISLRTFSKKQTCVLLEPFGIGRRKSVSVPQNCGAPASKAGTLCYFLRCSKNAQALGRIKNYKYTWLQYNPWLKYVKHINNKQYKPTTTQLHDRFSPFVGCSFQAKSYKVAICSDCNSNVTIGL